MKAIYSAFGRLIAELRQKAGIAYQADLARLVEVKQQSISRWEKGTSRPRATELNRLAQALGVHVDVLTSAIAHGTPVVTTSFDAPFPVAALNSDSFERFCAAWLSYQHSDAQVHRYGSTGHTQSGIDIEAVFPDGVRYTYQCKREQTFGPAKVDIAVAAHTAVAHKKVLLLARVATPAARDAVSRHADWLLWDLEDISRSIRKLSREQQIQLVDTFFPGHRFPLLGIRERGPWQTVEEYFAPFMVKENPTYQGWTLVGRTTIAERIAAATVSPDVSIVIVGGKGGVGKTRMLRSVLQLVSQRLQGTSVHVLPKTETVTRDTLDTLGTQPKLIVVDDAHEREDLMAIFGYVAVPEHQTRVLLSTRTHGRTKVRETAAAVGLIEQRVSESLLEPLTRSEAKELALEVLKAHNGPDWIAEDIANATYDCPLATVVGSYVVARKLIVPSRIKGDRDFRDSLLSKFQDVITGSIAAPSDQASAKKLLRLLALVQPFSLDDAAIAKLSLTIEEIDEVDTHRLTRLYVDAGILIKQGRRTRISPDLLADHILDETCINVNGSSTGYAERVFDAAPTYLIENILVNLGKLDWIRSSGDTGTSDLVSQVWRKLEPSGTSYDPHTKALSSVAYYYPKRALDFVEQVIRENRSFDELPTIIAHAAHNFEYVPRACESLWELSARSETDRGGKKSTALAKLTELCSVTRDKPMEYCEAVVRYGLKLLDDNHAWMPTLTPYDFLEGILRTQGHDTTWSGAGFAFTPYFVRLEAVRGLRTLVIDAAIQRFSCQHVSRAVRSVAFLENALRPPMTFMGQSEFAEASESWSGEFQETLEKIERYLITNNLDDLVVLRIARLVSYQAKFSHSPTGDVARRILALQPKSLQYLIAVALVDGYGHLREETDYISRKKSWDEALANLAAKTIKKHSDPAVLHAALCARLTHIRREYVRETHSPNIFFFHLFKRSQAIAKQVIEVSLTDFSLPTNQFVGLALSMLYDAGDKASMSFVRNLLDSGDRTLLIEATCALPNIIEKGGADPAALGYLQEMLVSSEEQVVVLAINSLRALAKHDKPLALSMLLQIDMSKSPAVADQVLEQLTEDNIGSIQSLRDEQIQAIFRALMKLSHIDKHWVQEFLTKASKLTPVTTAAFLMARVESASASDAYARGYAGFDDHQLLLQFRESSVVDSLIENVWSWLRHRAQENSAFEHDGLQLFAVMFRPFDDFYFDFLKARARLGIHDFSLAVRAFAKTGHKQVLERQALVSFFLDTATAHGPPMLKEVMSELYEAAAYGARSGTYGQPFPRDLEAREKSRQILSTANRFSATYQLYEMILKKAEQEIAERSGEIDDED